MGSLISKDFFHLSLCLITLFTLASCASTTSRSIAYESAVQRSPEGDYKVTNNKEFNRQFTRDRN